MIRGAHFESSKRSRPGGPFKVRASLRSSTWCVRFFRTRPIGTPTYCSLLPERVSPLCGCAGALKQQGVGRRFVRMPSWAWFEQLTMRIASRYSTFGHQARVSVEQASRFGWKGCRPGGRSDWHSNFWSVSAAEELLKKFGIHSRPVVSLPEQWSRVTR